MSIREIKGEPDDTWEDVEWDDMSAAEQELWGKLGWTKKTWDDEDEEEDYPDSDDKDWEELSSSEQAALKKLGYSEETWDGDDDDDDDE